MPKINWKRKGFDLGSASVSFLVIYGVQLLFQVVVLFFGLSDAAKTWTIVIGNQIVLIAGVLLFCIYKKVNPLEITGLKRPPKWYLFPIFILLAVACLAAFAPLAGVFSQFLGKLGYEYTPSYHIPTEDAGLFALAFLALTILPALGEESAVRGMLLSGGKERSPLFAIFFSALIFALMHGNLRQLVHQFLLGLTMGYLAYLTGGIYASAVLHIVNNGVALLFEYGFRHGAIDPRAYWYLGGQLDPVTTVIGVAISFFAIAMLLVLVTCLIHRTRSKEKGVYLPQEGKVLVRINRYLTYLSASPEKTEGRDRTYATAMAAILAAVLGVIVLLTTISGI